MSPVLSIHVNTCQYMIYVLQVATSLQSVQTLFPTGLESGAPSDVAVNTSSHVILEPKLWL